MKELNFKPYDFSVDIIPLLLGKIFTYHTDEVYLDIGTPSSLKFAQNFLKEYFMKSNNSFKDHFDNYFK